MDGRSIARFQQETFLEEKMIRFQLQLVIFLILAITESFPNNYKLKSDKNRELNGHCTISNTTVSTIGQCLQRCLGNCLCKSFQLCHKNECQLCSSNKYMRPAAMRYSENCSTFNFDLTEAPEKKCGTTCSSPPINCCLTSSPCLNGGTCAPLRPNHLHGYSRYSCKCPRHYRGERCKKMECAPGYAGKLCERKIKSCKDIAWARNCSNLPSPEIYTILDDNLNPFKVFCDFEKQNSTIWSWTLVQSYALYENDKFLWSSFVKDRSRLKKGPNWHLHRHGKPAMLSIRNESTKWRITCGYNTANGVDYRDYVRASFSEIDLLHFDGEKCVKVDYISIRGQYCSNCTAYAFQKSAIFHFPSHRGNCEFQLNDYKTCNISDTHPQKRYESNLGFYACANDQHRCSAHPNATTQTWFGASEPMYTFD